MEIEVKLTYSNRAKIITWLKQNKFKLAKKKEIRDSYYSLGQNSMSGINSFYRVRDVVGAFTELTLKDNFQENNGIMARREINVTIDDPNKIAIILTSLGCSLFKEHFCKREIWENRQVQFEFIDYYKPAKLSLIEIEGPDNEVIQTLIDDLGDKVKVADDEIFSAFDKKAKVVGEK
ncbi:MAG: CYTH domain-containing protein [Candidatus Daviesbacteria bacterium]